MEGVRSFCKSLLKFSLLIILLTASINCGVKDKKYYTHPNAYLVDQLANKKVIMLADFAHGLALPYKSLITLLNEWIDKVKSGESQVYKLSLILEADTQEVAILNEFIATGDWKPFIDYWLPYNTMEWLEFCADLRSLKQRIDSLNTDSLHKISFTLFGGEPGNIFDDPHILMLSKEDGSRYFVNVRDSLTAKNIIKHLRIMKIVKQ